MLELRDVSFRVDDEKDKEKDPGACKLYPGGQ